MMLALDVARSETEPLDPEALAIRLLAWIADRNARLDGFLQETGLHASEVRTAASSPSFLPSVLDYVLSDEGIARSAARDIGIRPADMALARADLMAGKDVLPLVLRCANCGSVKRLDRRHARHVPGRVARIEIPRCADCGGGFDPMETWFDAESREVGPYV